ncbi:MAG: hypothetical protein COB12_11460 [Flavobacterium sp.]|nr:MAG: hypothetical protein COB12_11460 [Flavobacterium sp.]
MKKYFYLLFLFINGIVIAQEFDYSIFLKAQGIYGTNDESPFWFYSNQNGQLDGETNFLGLVSFEASFKKSKNLNFEAAVNYFYSDGIENEVKRNEFYIKYYNKYIQAIVGAKNPEVKLDGLSSSNQNFLYSGNARSLPGILIEANEFFPIFKTLSVDWGIAHYELNDDRFVDGTMVHYKRIGFNWKINEKHSVYARFQHFAQWGGTSPTQGKQPDSFNDFIKVFFGRGGGEESGAGDQQNVLGNHLGSYFLEYKYEAGFAGFTFYWEHPFEDGSGTSFKNFPDGIWGLFIDLKKNNFFKSFLYEYVDTTNQSGGTGISGKDNYFMNKLYRSGWTYDGRTLGLPFISVPFNTRTRIHQIGFTSIFKKFNFTFKTSFVQNLGTYFVPYEPFENAIYTYLKTDYSFDKFGNLSLQVGYDTSDVNKDHFGAGLAYSIGF